MNIFYWIVMLDNISGVLCGLTVLSWFTFVISLIIATANYFCSYEELKPELSKYIQKYLKIFVPILLLLSLLAMLVPDTKQACAIYLLPKIVENKELSSLPTNIAILANKWIEELSPTNIKNDNTK